LLLEIQNQSVNKLVASKIRIGKIENVIFVIAQRKEKLGRTRAAIERLTVFPTVARGRNTASNRVSGRESFALFPSQHAAVAAKK